MSSVNKVILVGNLGADPEVKQFSNGGSLTNVVIATSEKYTNKQGEKVEETEWHRVSFFGKTGEIAAQYLRKGSKVYVEGSIKTRKYQAADGSDRYATEIKGFNLTMLGEASGGQQNQQQNNQQQNPQQRQAPQQGFNNQTTQAPKQTMANAVIDDDCPF